MFRKMMVCTDLTPASDVLIGCVAALKEIGTREVILTHVIQVVNTTGLEVSLAADAEPVLERQKKLLEEQGLAVIVEMPLGVPVQTLQETAEKHEVSAILVGSHGKGLVKSVTLGSVSIQLLHRTRRPLLLDRIDLSGEGGRGEGGCRRMFDRVLFPTDFSETAERALDYLGKIALETGCVVTLLHVLAARDDDPAGASRREEDARYLLEAKKRRLEKLGAAVVSIDVAYGRAADEIVSRSRDGRFTSVVMGGHGKGLLKELLLGSTANEVARHAELPLLFVPAERQLPH